MLKKFLEPSIEKRIVEVFEKFTKSNDITETYTQFMHILTELNGNVGFSSPIKELEDIFWLNSTLSIEYSYRAGFEDAIKIFNR